MSSRSEHPTHPTGAHRAQRRAARAPRPLAERPPACYEPYLDGLFTYCLSVLCDHDAATAALGEALAVAERRRLRGRAAGFTAKDGGAAVPPPMASAAPPPMAPELSLPPGRARAPGPGKHSPSTDVGLRRPWLYALARWSCLRTLTELRAGGPRPARSRAAHPGHPHPVLAPTAPAQRRRDLAALAWPEAAGTSPEQREALELAVRHQLSPHEVAAVIGGDPDETRALLASAACEVERTRAALAVVELGRCPTVSRLAGDAQVLLSAALRRELVRHVDDCGQCRRTAERATAGGPWPGTATAPAALPILEAPRAAVCAAMQWALRGRSPRAAAWPRFDRRGFPIDPKDRAARRSRLRSRAVTTTVVATVIAAPVLALWAAYRGAPLTGESQAGGGGVSATERDDLGGAPYEEAGNARGNAPDADVGWRSPERRDPAERKQPKDPADGAPTASPAATPGAEQPTPGTGSSAPVPGQLTVAAQPSGDATLIILTAAGGPVRWSAVPDAPWLLLSQSSGELGAGESVTLVVTVDHAREPVGPWTGRISVTPTGSVVTIEGVGEPTAPEPTPTPTEPTPTPTPTPAPSDPTPQPTEPAGSPAP
ncbi:sigma-70 family RNA polymerase sigma factor [Streptomyces sp. 796.1]|uniref:sigma-70 family RNA polymerase sigma factor n=1 Tax=Streptomyces sp. 796.1 TaxID=3163029 RepID=UPI0039C93AF9